MVVALRAYIRGLQYVDQTQHRFDAPPHYRRKDTSMDRPTQPCCTGNLQHSILLCLHLSMPSKLILLDKDGWKHRWSVPRYTYNRQHDLRVQCFDLCRRLDVFDLTLVYGEEAADDTANQISCLLCTRSRINVSSLFNFTISHTNDTPVHQQQPSFARRISPRCRIRPISCMRLLTSRYGHA